MSAPAPARPPSPGLARLRADARDIFGAGLRAVEPRAAVRAHLRLDGDAVMVGSTRFPLSPTGRVRVVAVGKAAAPMAQEAEAILGPRLCEGIAVTKRGHGVALERVLLRESGHPIPDAAGLAATAEVERLLADGRPQDLVLCLVSGGASALLPSPAPGLGLAEEQAVAALLLACGADIAESNAVRKHLSRLKGGGLVRAARPAGAAGLILSDVVGDPLDVVGSGPTVADPTTVADARAIIARYGLRLPPHIEAFLAMPEAETPKPGDARLAGVETRMVAAPALSIAAAGQVATAAGYRVIDLGDRVEGEAREVGREHAHIALKTRGPAAILSGGETTVTLTGTGRGGRNSEYALALAIALEGTARISAIACDTDGIDGSQDNAGAMVLPDTLARARRLGLDPGAFLANNDAFGFFAALGDLVVTGPTLTNVNDFRAVVVEPDSGQRQA